MAEKTTKTTTIHEKLLKLQMEIGGVKKGKNNPFFNSAYFDINSLLHVVKPILNELGLYVLQPLTTDVITGKPAIETVFCDAETGEKIASVTPLPDISDVQKMGSAITYYRRFALQSFLGLEAEDDDGNTASKTPVSKTAAPSKPIAPKTVREKGFILPDGDFLNDVGDDVLDNILN